MISKNLPQSSCEMRFGISGLNNPSLVENFYPEDLPEDWRFSYYSNEFHLLLISLPDLNIPFSSPQEMEAVAPDEIVEALAQFCDELEQEFVLLFDTTKLSDNSRYVLSDVLKKAADNCLFINLNNMDEEARSACLTKTECDFSLVKGKDSLQCIVTDEQQIAAVELRQLVEQLRTYAILKQYKSVHMLFSSAHNALENCRNAILLESMM